MNHNLVLSIRLLEQSGECLVFELSLRNDSTTKLLLPMPDSPSFEFRRVADGKLVEWYTHLLINCSGVGTVLAPGELKFAKFWARTSCPPTERHDDRFRFRWHIPLEAGRYRVRVHFEVGPNYFDPDSHWRLADLEREAIRTGADVWLGEAFSNELEIGHDPASE